jgi:hypothetical protein
MAVKGVDLSRTSIDHITNAGLTSKTVTGVKVHQHGSVTVFEIVFSGGSTFLKERSGLAEVGGTIEWGTGTAAF